MVMVVLPEEELPADRSILGMCFFSEDEEGTDMITSFYLVSSRSLASSRAAGMTELSLFIIAFASSR